MESKKKKNENKREAAQANNNVLNFSIIPIFFLQEDGGKEAINR